MYDELYIAEKPSLGQAIVEGLVALSKRPGNEGGDSVVGVRGERGNSHVIVGGKKVVTWFVGHMYEQYVPEDYNPAFAGGFQKSRHLLPHLPAEWKLKPVARTRAQLNVVNDLIKQSAVLINAGDPDDEGQLLIDEALHHINNKKPVRRLLLNALDPASVSKSLLSQRDNKEFYTTYLAALCRSEADYLLGMNGTRSLTVVNETREMLTVGRVQTPTLALVVKRALEIRNFKPETYYMPTPEFTHNNGNYKGKWVPPAGQIGLDKKGRLTDETIAKKISTEIKGKPGSITEYSVKAQSDTQPLAFSLSALQTKASAAFGMSATEVLNIAQSLYEVHKVASYPRSDSGYLKESQHGESPGILAAISKFDSSIAALVTGADRTIKSPTWNDKKVDAHHGIIPTAAANYGSLTPNERKVFTLIVKQYLAQFYPEYSYNQTLVLTHCGGHNFKSSGRTPIDYGWRKVFGIENEDTAAPKKKEGEEDQKLPKMAKGDTVICSKVSAEKKSTKAPTPYSEGTLLMAMQNIGETVEDPEMRKKLKEVKGIGTPATQAPTLERLKKVGYWTVEKNKLIPTEGAIQFIEMLPKELTDPVITAMWNISMDRVKSGDLTYEQFMKGQYKWITDLVKKTLATPISISLKGNVNAAQAGGTSGRSSTSPSMRSTTNGSSSNNNGQATAMTVCPKCGKGALRVMTAKNGPNAGNTFMGCNTYPTCKHTESIQKDAPATSLSAAQKAAAAPALAQKSTGFRAK
jgi:DNA topoisomerase-3